MSGCKSNLQPFFNDIIKKWLNVYLYILILSFPTNHVHSSALTRSLLPDISPFLVGIFSTSIGLSWYHASIAPLPVILFSTPMSLLSFIELPCFKILLNIDSLPAGLFNTPMGLLHIMILSIWKLVGTRVC